MKLIAAPIFSEELSSAKHEQVTAPNGDEMSPLRSSGTTSRLPPQNSGTSPNSTIWLLRTCTAALNITSNCPGVNEKRRI